MADPIPVPPDPVPVPPDPNPKPPPMPIDIPKWILVVIVAIGVAFGTGFLFGQRHPIGPTPPQPGPGPGPIPPLVIPTKDNPVVTGTMDKAGNWIPQSVFEIPVGSADPIFYKTFKDAKGAWFSPPGNYKLYWYPDHVIFNPHEDGEWMLGVNCAVDGQAVDPLYVKVRSGKGPQPPPIPPDPGPGPIPKPIPPPIDSQSFKALVIYKDPKLDPDGFDKAQKIVLSGDWASYMKTKMVGSNPCWRFFPEDIQFPDASHAMWQKAMQRPRTATPWLILSNGTANLGWEGPLPINGTTADNVAATMALVRKVGG